jgi:hypothetical protein
VARGCSASLKEDFIMGQLIPAGTGMEFYWKIKIPDEVIEGVGEGGMEASTPHRRSKGRPRQKTLAALRVW